jgi:hypothetical protein
MILDSARKTPVPVLARWLYRGDTKTWEMCPRGDSQLTYTTPVTLATEFTLLNGGAS